MACSDQINTTDLENAKVDAITIAEVANSRTGGSAGGALIDETTTRFLEPVSTLRGQLTKLGYEVPIAYASGISFTVDDGAKTIEEGGIIYAPLISSLPFTTSGTFVGDDDSRFRLAAQELPSALILDGQTGFFARPKGQLVLISDEADPTSHAIASAYVLNPLDEGAWEVLLKYDDGLTRQLSAMFTRTIDMGAGEGDFATAESVSGIHLVGKGGIDNTPFLAWSNNSVMLCGGQTGLLPMYDILPENMAYVKTYLQTGNGARMGYGLEIRAPRAEYGLDVSGYGAFGEVNPATGELGHQLQVIGKHPIGSSILQSYDVDDSQFKPLNINASSITVGQGHLLFDQDNTRDIGSQTKKVRDLWAGRIICDSLTVGQNVTYTTGSGSPEGIVSANKGSIYTNSGAGTTLYVKESGSGNTGWVGK